MCIRDSLEDARKLGESEGEVRGEARGKVMGEVVREAIIILKMNHSGMSPENIASITGKDLDEICLLYTSPRRPMYRI